MRHATASHQGLVRTNNEDSAFAGARLLVIADGVGGEAAGEVASALAVDAFRPLDGDEPGEPVEALRAAVLAANDRIAQAVREDPALAGMGTTLTALLVCGRQVTLAHVGDSRAYRLRAGALTQLTRDDTYVQQLVDEGRLGIEEARSHPQRSVVTRVLQGVPVDASFARYRTAPGDRYLLCSDGLPDYAAPEALAARLREHTEPEDCAAQLVELALAGGGGDNVTVIVADIVSRDARTRRFLPVLAVLAAAALLGLAGWYLAGWYLAR
jgi:PPM family protein phosphatase